MIIPFIKVCLHGIQLFSPEAAARSAVFIGGHVRKHPRKDRELEALGRAEKLEIKKPQNGRKLIAWSWGEGPVVLIAHGWESRGSQMSSIAEAVAAKGYQAVAIDFTAHGDSEEKRTSFSHFSEDIQLLSSHFNHKIDAFIGYSAGGISSIYSYNESFSPKRQIIIASPCAPYPAIKMTQHAFNLNAQTVDAMKSQYAGLLDMTWDELEACEYYSRIKTPALFINSTADKDVTPEQMQGIVDNWGGDKELVTLDDLSHRQLMWDQKVLDLTTDFLEESKQTV